MSNTALLTPAQLAERWGKKPKTLANQRHAGIGPRYIKIGRTIRYTMNDVEAFEQANTQGGGT